MTDLKKNIIKKNKKTKKKIKKKRNIDRNQ